MRSPRPAVLVAVHLAAGIVLAAAPEGRPIALFGLVALHGLRRSAAGDLVLGAVFLAAGIGLGLRSPGGPAGRLAVDERTIHRLEGRVAEPVRIGRDDAIPGNRISFDLRVERVDGGPCPGRVQVVVAAPAPDLRPGDRVAATGRLETLRTAGNEGQFDRAARAARRGTAGRLVVPDAALVDVEPAIASPRAAIDRFRRASAERMARDLPGPGGEVARRALLGPEGPLDDEVREDFRAAGAAHLLAVSGLHVSVLLGVFWWLAGSAGLRRPAAVALLALVLVPFVLVIGLQASIVRAALLTGGSLLAERLGRRVDRLQLLALVATIHLAFRPRAIFDPGFQLSYAATFAIVEALAWRARARRPTDPLERLVEAARPWRRRWRRLLRAAGDAATVSAAAWTATAPLLAHHFGVVQPVGLVANIVLVPVFALALAAALPYAVLAGLGLDGPATVAALPARLLFGLLCRLAEAAGSLPGAEAAIGAPSAWAVALALALVLGLWRLRPRRPVALAAVVAAGLLLAARPAGRPALEVVFLDVGHGGATLLVLPDGSVALYDAGSLDHRALDDRILTPALRRLGVGPIETVFVSHGDLDHTSALADVVASHRPRRLVATARVAASGILPPGPEVRIVRAGDAIDLGRGVRATVLAPGPSAAGTDNDASLVLLVEGGGGRVLLTGDLEEAGLAALDPAPPPVDVLQLPHHGEAVDGLDRLLDATRPRWAVSPARDGWTDRPTIDLCRRAGAAFLETGTDGAVTATFDGGRVAVGTFREPRPGDQ